MRHHMVASVVLAFFGMCASSALAGSFNLPTQEEENCVTPYEDGASPQIEVNNSGPSSITVTVTYSDDTTQEVGISALNSHTFSMAGKTIKKLKICINGGGSASGTYTVTPPSEEP